MSDDTLPDRVKQLETENEMLRARIKELEDMLDTRHPHHFQLAIQKAGVFSKVMHVPPRKKSDLDINH